MKTSDAQWLMFGWLFALLLSPVRAEDLAVVLHPSTALVPDDFKPDPKNENKWMGLNVLATSKPALIVGKSAIDAPGGRTFVIELEDPRTFTISHIGFGGINGKKGDVPYKEVVAVQPFSLWYRPAAGAAPELMGRSFVWDREKGLRALNPNGSAFEVTSDSSADLTLKALRRAVASVPGQFSEAVAEKILPAPVKANFTSEVVLDWARKFPSRGQGVLSFKNGRFDYDITALKLPPGSNKLSLTCRPSRVAKAEDGGIVVEVDLHNRLPVRVAGILRRDGGKPEGELEGVLRKKGIGISSKTRSARFNLAADEKQVVKFPIPKEVSSDPAFFKSNEIEFTLTGLGEVAQRAFHEAKAQAKKAKKAKNK